MTLSKERIKKVKTCIYPRDYRSDSQRRKFTRLVDTFINSTVVMFGTDGELKSIGESFIIIDNSTFSEAKKAFLFNALFNTQ